MSTALMAKRKNRNTKGAEAEFERFRQAWSSYPGAVDVWLRNWSHVEQLFNYGNAVRKVMYTTYTDKKTMQTFCWSQPSAVTRRKISA